MDKSSKSYKQERAKIRAWSSRSVRWSIVYGLFALYSAILVPFIPINEGVAFISDTHNAGFVFAVLTSLVCIMLGILVVAKLRKYGNGAVYTLHNIFFYFLLIYSAITVAVRIIEDDEIYNVLYYYAIFTDIAFGVGILFIQVAQFCDSRLHVVKVKGFYFLFAFIVAALAVGINIFAYSIMDAGYVGGARIDSDFKTFYKLFYLFAGAYAFCVWYQASLPVNELMEPFGGKFYRKKTATSKVGYIESIVFLAFLFVEAVYYAVSEYYIMLFAMFIGILLVSAVITWGVIYNKSYTRKLRLLSIQAEKEEEERRQKEEREKNERESVDQEMRSIAADVPLYRTETVKDKEINIYDEGGSYLINARALLNQNSRVSDLYSTKINGFIKYFVKQAKTENVELSEKDASTLIAAFASSRVIFVGGVNPSIIKNFMLTVSDAFDTDVFVEKYYEKLVYMPEYEYVLAEEQPIAQQNEETVAQQGEQPAAQQNEENTGLNEELGVSDISVEEKQTEPVKEHAPVYVKKEKPFVKTENVINQNKKHGVVSGIFAANCLGHYIDTLFFDCTETGISKQQAELFRAISSKQETLHVGNHTYLPKADFYMDEDIELPDNLWTVCFIGEEQYKDALSKYDLRYSDYIKISPLFSEGASSSNDEGGEEVYDDNGFLSYEGIVKEVEEAEDENYISEECWNKIDKLISALKLPPEYAFDNRFIRQMEIFSSVQKLTGKTDEEILDMLIAFKVLPYLASCGWNSEGVDWLDVFDKIIGADNLALSQKAITELGFVASRSSKNVK